MATKPIITYRTHQHEEGSQYAFLTIQIFVGRLVDAAKEYDNEPSTYNLERLQKIREQSSSTKYFSHTYAGEDRSFSLRFQTDAGQSGCDHWYAPRIESGSFTPDTLRAMQRIQKALETANDHLWEWNLTPAQVFEALNNIRAMPVKHAVDVYDAWILVDPPTEDDWRPPFAEQEKEEALV